MNSPFAKNLGWSVLGHIGILVLIVFLFNFSIPPKPSEPIRWVDIASEPGNSPAPLPSQPPPSSSTPPKSAEPMNKPTEPSPPLPSPQTPPEPTSLAPPPKPETTPPPPTPVPPTTPKPEPKAKEVPAKSKETPSKTVVKNVPPKTAKTTQSFSKSKTTTNKPKISSSKKEFPSASQESLFDPSAFSKNLLSKLPDHNLVTIHSESSGSGSGNAKSSTSEFSSYFNQIIQEMYSAWHPPFGLDEGLTTQILIRVEKNGVISKVSLASSSGNKFMDESALAAASSVKKLSPLPQGLGDSFAEITVHFKKQKQ